MPLTTLFIGSASKPFTSTKCPSFCQPPTAALLESEVGGNVSTERYAYAGPEDRTRRVTSCTAVEREYDRASQAGIYFTMTLDRRTNGYDQNLCVLAKNSLIWIYTVFYAYTWPFKIIDNVVCYTPPQVSGGYYVFTLAVRVSVRPSALRFRSIAKVFINRFHSNFAYVFAPTMSRLGLLMGKFR